MSNIEALVRRWQTGDERAAEAIYNHYQGVTFGLAYTLLDDADDAEEVAQDALTYALTHINHYDPQKARFATWLHTITISRCRNKRRRRFFQKLPFGFWFKKSGDSVVDPSLSLEQQAMQGEMHDEVWAAIQTLNQPLREAILLRHWADYTYKEIGDMLGCSMRTAQSRVRLAHNQLGEILSHNDVVSLEERVR